MTDDQTLLDTHKMLKQLRDDEYVHWKGHRSTARVLYSFTAFTSTKCEFGTNAQMEINDTVGPAQMSEQVRKLISATQTHVQENRAKEIKKLVKLFEESKTWETTELLNSRGESILKRT